MRPMLDSLDLDGDDAWDIERNLESAFEISLSDLDRPCVTVGDVHDRVLERFAAGPGEGRCATSMAFYRLRAALGSTMPGGWIGPETALRHARMSPDRLNRHLRDATGMDLHVGYGAWPTLLGLASVCLALALAVLLRDGRWLLLACGVALIPLDRGACGRQTVGDVAREAAALNFARLARDGADHRPERIWRVIVQIVADVTGLDGGRIDRKTRLFPAAP